MNKIKKVSHFFKRLLQLYLVILSCFTVISWIYAPELSIKIANGAIGMATIPHVYLTGPQGNVIMHTLNSTEKLLGFLVDALPLAIELMAVCYLIKLFKSYELGEIFSLNTVRYIRNVGIAIATYQLINPIAEFLLGFILTWRNPKGHGFASMTFNDTNFTILLTALFIILISWITAEGYKIREEQQLTI